MEFNKKLQELRKQKGLTQEELADLLYVSRVAVSKWESGRGYPNLESLKAIAKLFSVTVDELLSSDELLSLAEEDCTQKEHLIRELVFGLLDLSVAVLFFLPLFGQKSGEIVESVSLLSLNGISLYLKSFYLAFVTAITVWGVLTLALQSCDRNFWVHNKSKISMLLNAVATILFIVSLQPYAAMVLFIFLSIKVLLIIKKH